MIERTKKALKDLLLNKYKKKNLPDKHLLKLRLSLLELLLLWEFDETEVEEHTIDDLSENI